MVLAAALLGAPSSPAQGGEGRLVPAPAAVAMPAARIRSRLEVGVPVSADVRGLEGSAVRLRASVREDLTVVTVVRPDGSLQERQRWSVATSELELSGRLRKAPLPVHDTTLEVVCPDAAGPRLTGADCTTTGRDGGPLSPTLRLALERFPRPRLPAEAPRPWMRRGETVDARPWLRLLGVDAAARATLVRFARVGGRRVALLSVSLPEQAWTIGDAAVTNTLSGVLRVDRDTGHVLDASLSGPAAAAMVVEGFAGDVALTGTGYAVWQASSSPWP